MDIPTVRIQGVTTIYQMSLLLAAFLSISPNRRFRATQVLRLCAVLMIRSRLGGGYRYYQVTMRTLLMGTKRMRPKKIRKVWAAKTIDRWTSLARNIWIQVS
jgi:hypothetical protein